MRTIEFRGMTISGEWVYGYVRQNNNPRMKYQGWFISDSMHEPLAYEVRPETIGQFTGRLDKNGTKIYEGDICNRYFLNVLDVQSVIVFYNGKFMYKHLEREAYEDICPQHCEVVGNIHQVKGENN